jgi:hypothetical protein
MEPGRDQLVHGRVRLQVARDLIDDEAAHLDEGLAAHVDGVE